MEINISQVNGVHYGIDQEIVGKDTGREGYTSKDGLVAHILSKPQPNLNTRLGLTIKLLCTHHPPD